MHSAVRSAVTGEAVTGDARSAAAASRGDARSRRSRPGRAKRGLRRAWRAAPARGDHGGSADDAVEPCRDGAGSATAVSAASRRGKRSAQRPKGAEARGIPARRAETAQRARQGSPVAKRRAQTHCRVRHTVHHHRYHHGHRRCRQRTHGRHHHRQHHDRHRRRNQRRHRRRRWQHVVVVPGVTANRDVLRMVNGQVRDPVRRTSGGAAAEHGAAGAGRREGEPCGGALGSDQKERGGPRRTDATREAMRLSLPASPGCRASRPCRRGCR